MRLVLFTALVTILNFLHAQSDTTFLPFTGKIAANKVRIRSKPDLESPVVRQVNKNELLLVVGEVGDFYVVQPMKDVKAYVFRSYIIDNIVEANRVNVRLEPHVDAPVIGQLFAGDKIDGIPCSLNHKWLEIAPPKGSSFYVSKDFVTKAGGPEYIGQIERKKVQVESLLSSAFLNAEAECAKSYETMAPQQAIDQFQTIVRNFAEFPEAQKQAKEGLSLLKETYLNKKIAYLEEKAQLSPTLKQELIAQHKAENGEMQVDPSLWKKNEGKPVANNLWGAIEESLYLSWTAFHSGKTLDDYYAEQKANAAVLIGTIEKYNYDVRNKPGDYFLRGAEDVPVAFLYSTAIDLEKFMGQTVTILASPRPNNHFAFPAYFVFNIE